LSDIAEARDFCSFRGMKFLPAILIISSLCSIVGKANAFSCDEFRAAILAITAEDKAIDAQHKAVGTSDADQCRFNREIFIPYVTRTMQSVALYGNCPKSGSVAAALAGEYEKSLKVLNDLDAGRCQ
jgi:hypothetical protein